MSYIQKMLAHTLLQAASGHQQGLKTAAYALRALLSTTVTNQSHRGCGMSSGEACGSL